MMLQRPLLNVGLAVLALVLGASAHTEAQRRRNGK
jgi:hypothetical protein